MIEGQGSAVDLRVAAPYAFDELLEFVAQRAARGVEGVVDGRYVRSLVSDGVSGWLAVARAPAADTLRLEVSPSLAPQLPRLARLTASAWDLEVDPASIAAALGALASACPGLRVPGTMDPFELAVRAVLGQQISVRAASTLAGRLARAHGEPCETPFGTIDRATPTAAAIARLDASDLVALGVTAARARTIVTLARAFDAGTLDLHPDADPERAIAGLTALSGIGDWTAHYIAMRALRWADAFPASDLVILRALGERSARAALARAEAWRPWRAYAAMHLWRSQRAPE